MVQYPIAASEIFVPSRELSVLNACIYIPLALDFAMKLDNDLILDNFHT